MRIGVVGDTHDRLLNVDRIVRLFNEARVERVVHTGDLTGVPVLEKFAELESPLVGVFGNNDLPEHSQLEAEARRLGMDFVLPPRTLDWADRRILVVHDPEDVATQSTDEIDLVLHGHTHRHRLEKRGETIFFNPGECAGQLTGHNSIGVIDLVSLEIDRLRF